MLIIRKKIGPLSFAVLVCHRIQRSFSPKLILTRTTHRLTIRCRSSHVKNKAPYLQTTHGTLTIASTVVLSRLATTPPTPPAHAKQVSTLQNTSCSSFPSTKKPGPRSGHREMHQKGEKNFGGREERPLKDCTVYPDNKQMSEARTMGHRRRVTYLIDVLAVSFFMSARSSYRPAGTSLQLLPVLMISLSLSVCMYAFSLPYFRLQQQCHYFGHYTCYSLFPLFHIR